MRDITCVGAPILIVYILCIPRHHAVIHVIGAPTCRLLSILERSIMHRTIADPVASETAPTQRSQLLMNSHLFHVACWLIETCC